MDPLELRLKNAAREGVKPAHGPVYSRIGYIETLEAARTHEHYKAPLGKYQVRGVASGYWFNAGGESSACRSTSPRTATSSSPPAIPDIGGSRAAIANVAAELLGNDYHRGPRRSATPLRSASRTGPAAAA